jgi:hypothetical protein
MRPIKKTFRRSSGAGGKNGFIHRRKAYAAWQNIGDNIVPRRNIKDDFDNYVSQQCGAVLVVAPYVVDK